MEFMTHDKPTGENDVQPGEALMELVGSQAGGGVVRAGTPQGPARLGFL